jgi:hypothetical protein
MKQFKVALPDDLRSRLEKAAERSGRSIADEIRKRVEKSFDTDAAEGPTEALAAAVPELATLVRSDTGSDWHTDPASHCIFGNALAARLQRLRPDGDQKFDETKLPKHRLVASSDPEAIGLAIEAMEFQKAQEIAKLQQLREEVLAEHRAIREAVNQKLKQGQKS